MWRKEVQCASIYVRGVSNDKIKKNKEEGIYLKEKKKLTFLKLMKRWMLSAHKMPKRRDEEKPDLDIMQKSWNSLEREDMWSTKEQESYWH